MGFRVSLRDLEEKGLLRDLEGKGLLVGLWPLSALKKEVMGKVYISLCLKLKEIVNIT